MTLSIVWCGDCTSEYSQSRENVGILRCQTTEVDQDAGKSCIVHVFRNIYTIHTQNACNKK